MLAAGHEEARVPAGEARFMTRVVKAQPARRRGGLAVGSELAAVGERRSVHLRT